MPEGTILAGSDKGLGLCLLPIDWYIKQYEVQSIKGGHILTKMSKDQCINQLKETIQIFRQTLGPEERNIIKSIFVKGSPKCSIGVLKLVPKVHKIATFDSNSWELLPSRPIRGAENCPVNPYSFIFLVL